MIMKLVSALALLVIGFLLVWLAARLLDHRLAAGNIALLFALFLLLPLVFKAHYLLFLIENQSLISFNIELPGVFLLLCAGYPPSLPVFSKSRRFRAASALLALALAWQNIVFANEVYLKKELEKNASLSVVIRILVQIEQLNGYVPNEPPVAFAG